MLWVVLPAYNEVESIGMLLDRMVLVLEEERRSYRIIVVNDGSTDGTAGEVLRAAAAHPIELVDRSENRGLAETLKQGLFAALERAEDGDIIITMDADNTHNPGLIIQMARLIREGHDLAIASRYRRGARVIGVPLNRRFLSWAGSWLFRILFPCSGIRDYTCGYRAYSVGLLRRALDRFGPALFNQSGFSCMVDILLKLRATEAIMTEVPLILRYDLKHGLSKMNVRGTTRETLRLAWRRRIGRFD